MATTQGEPPGIIRIAATAFLVLAWIAVADVIIALAQGRLQIALGLLGFWIASGLRRGDPRWRTWGLVLSWLGVAGAVLGVVLLMRGGPGDVTVFGVPRPDVSRWILLPVVLPMGLLSAWLCWSLTRSSARRWCQLPTASAPSSSEFPA